MTEEMRGTACGTQWRPERPFPPLAGFGARAHPGPGAIRMIRPIRSIRRHLFTDGGLADRGAARREP